MRIAVVINMPLQSAFSDFIQTIGTSPQRIRCCIHNLKVLSINGYNDRCEAEIEISFSPPLKCSREEKNAVKKPEQGEFNPITPTILTHDLKLLNNKPVKE